MAIPKTKTGTPRTIPLDWKTLTAIRRLAVTKSNRGIPTVMFSAKFKIVREKSGLPSGDFHCLRHSFMTWTAKKGLTPQQIASVSGHKTLSMVARYTHLEGTDVRELL